MIISNIILFAVVLSAIVIKAKSDGLYDEDEIIYEHEDEIKYRVGD